MPAGVVLDTSYLITLAKPDRANHGVAQNYWQYFCENEIPIYLSMIMVAEF